MTCRHCSGTAVADDYASVLAFGPGALEAKVQELESNGPVSSVCAFCPRCRQQSIVLYGGPSPFLYTLFLWQSFGDYLL